MAAMSASVTEVGVPQGLLLVAGGTAVSISAQAVCPAMAVAASTTTKWRRLVQVDSSVSRVASRSGAVTSTRTPQSRRIWPT